MAYKARRTRDLQGEVQAGTNVSVVETTKPDGTKVYTLSAEGGETITISGSGLQLIGNVLINLMAQRMGWTDEGMGKINWTDDNGDKVLVIDPLEQIFLGDADDGAGFFLKQLDSTSNKLISGDIQIAKDTASTEGVTLQTLADMINSMASFTMGAFYVKNGNNSFLFPTYARGINNNFYQEETETNYDINGNLFVGILIKHGGLYRVSFVSQFIVESTNIPTQNYLYCTISVINGINLDNREEKANSEIYITEIETGRYSLRYVVDCFIDLTENDILGYYIETFGNGNIYNIFAAFDPILTIQKVR